MKLHRTNSLRRRVILAALALAATTIALSSARPADAARPPLAANVPEPTLVGSASASLTSTETVIPIGGAFKYTATVRPKDELDYVQVRMRLLMPSGSLVYQKTHVDASKSKNTRVFEFERTIDDIGLEPGSYPVEVTVRVSSGGTVSEEVIGTRLHVFDPKAPRRELALVVRISPLSLTDPSGRFVADPALYVRARDEVTAIADHVIADPAAKLSMAVSPLMLEEWRMVAGGYRYETPEGVIEVAAEDPTPQSYAYAIDRLGQAIGTGRLELLSSGYSDPDLFALAEAGLSDDIGVQYGVGLARTRSTLEVTPSAGTAPAGGCISPDIAERLSAEGIRYVYVLDRCASSGRPGAYAAKQSTMTVLISDTRVASSLQSSPTAESVGLLFDRYAEDHSGPVPVVVDVGPKGATAERVLSFTRAIAAQEWTGLTTWSASADKNESLEEVTLTKPRIASAPPRGFWQDVAHARTSAGALVAALGANDETAGRALRESLVAQSSSWAGVADDWSQAPRALAYAGSAKSAANDVFGQISLNAKPVTLAGARGRVPVTIANGSGRTVRIRLTATPSSGMRQHLSPERFVRLNPQDNFVEIPVDLQGALSGTLNVSIWAGGLKISQTAVPLKASIIDRLVMLGGTVIVLAGLLVFIFTRVRAAEQADKVRPRQQ